MIVKDTLTLPSGLSPQAFMATYFRLTIESPEDFELLVEEDRLLGAVYYDDVLTNALGNSVRVEFGFVPGQDANLDDIDRFVSTMVCSDDNAINLGTTLEEMADFWYSSPECPRHHLTSET